MARVQFKPTTTKRKKPLTIGDCADGDIIYIESEGVFGLIIDTDFEETKVALFEDGDIDYYDNTELCKKFIGEIQFDIKEFQEFV